MSSENAHFFITSILSPMALVVAAGLIHMVILEFNHFFNLFVNPPSKKKQWQEALKPFYPRLKYIVGGMFISWFAYIITTFIYRQFPAATEVAPKASMLFGNFNEGNLFLLAIAGFVLCGYCLIVSAGSRWLINLSKAFGVIAVLLIFMAAAGIYLPMV